MLCPGIIFLKTRSNLKVTDKTLVNKEMKKSDRLWKITTSVEHICEARNKLPRKSNLNIDDQVILFMG